MYARSYLLGFHGCDASVGERILSGKAQITSSTNDHDWLGSGAYFWEDSPQRALQWAELVQRNPQHFGQKITKPFVVGAIIDPGRCLQLTEAESLRDLKQAYDTFASYCGKSGITLPINEPGYTGDLDHVKRHLDCAVINFAHYMREQEGLSPYDTVRGAFPEGRPLYTGARIMEQTHVQICVRHPHRSIRGYFRPLLREE